LFDKGVKPKVHLFAPDTKSKNASINSITNLMQSLPFGAFSEVIPSKLGDRVGLVFSGTTPVYQLRLSDIVAIPEVMGNGYPFSDGVGVMSLQMAQLVQRSMGPRAKLPGAIQIRLGGAKGMLSLNKDFTAGLIGVRPSMVKFPSPHIVLEVKKVARGNFQYGRRFYWHSTCAWRSAVLAFVCAKMALLMKISQLLLGLKLGHV
jgi:hypothetical protein